MRTPSPEAERYRHKVTTRLQDLLSGRRPRHPVLSQYSIQRLILEGVVEEARIWRLEKEQQLLREREPVARMDRNEALGEGKGKGGKESGKQGYRYDEGEDGRRGRSRGQMQRESGEYEHGESSRRVKSRERIRRERGGENHRLDPNSPGQGPSLPKQRFDRNGKPLVKGKRGWKDEGPGPYPEYKFKIGPLLGMGDHLMERFRWGVEKHQFEQKREARRQKGSLEERRKAKKETQQEKGEGKKPVKESRGSGKERNDNQRHGVNHRYAENRLQAQNLMHGEHKAHRKIRPRNYVEPVLERRSEDGDEQGERDRLNPYARDHHRARWNRRASNVSADGEMSDVEDYSNDEHLEDLPSRNRGRSRKPKIRGVKSHTSGNSVRSKPSQNAHAPRPAVYEETPHSRGVEERERAEALQEKGKLDIIS